VDDTPDVYVSDPVSVPVAVSFSPVPLPGETVVETPVRPESAMDRFAGFVTAAFTFSAVAVQSSVVVGADGSALQPVGGLAVETVEIAISPLVLASRTVTLSPLDPIVTVTVEPEVETLTVA
jgi:hypothetical protein